MALPNNNLEQVVTYQASSLAYLLNLNCFVSTANTQFKNFEKVEANLGDTISFDKPPRYVTNDSLIAKFQDSEHREHTLTVDKAANTAYAFNVQQFIFNVRDYMEKFGKAAIAELSAKVEADVACNALTHTYRFYGDGKTALNSYGDLAQMLANYRNYGATQDSPKVYLPDMAIPSIINSGLSQFVLDRNKEAANSWELGNFARAQFYQSNLLPIHLAGDCGNAGTVLTVESTNDPSGKHITQLTLSGIDKKSTNAFKANDLIQFQDTGSFKLRYLTFIGHQPSAQPVQCRVIKDAASDDKGNVTINIFPALVADSSTAHQNITTNIVKGMQIKALPNHRAGLIVGGNALYVGMPRLPEEVPYPTANQSDADTGVSLRMYYGSLFGQNQRGFVHDVIWGSTLVDEYAMRIVFPV
ncbi:MAG: hypothetical protein WCC83_01105 [Candidatus Rickettsiella isopodorum]